MTKKLLTVMLALICVMLFAVPAMAEEMEYSISGQYTLENANLSTITVKSGAEVTLVLAGTNTLTGKPAVIVENGAKLTISGSGTLNCGTIDGSATDNGGTIIINGGDINVTGNVDDAAAISGWKITINGGDVYVTNGTNNAPGIGAGAGQKVDTITISGGKVDATGGTPNGAGIGANGQENAEASVGLIKISGGEVIAKAGGGVTGRGAGIGMGMYSKVNTISISGGEIEATKGGHGRSSDIGGYHLTDVENIELLDLSYIKKGTVSRPESYHTSHDIAYNADGTTITAKCTRCGVLGSVTISAPAVDDLTYDGSSKDASLSYADWTLAEADKPTTITYNEVDRVNFTGNTIKASVGFGDKTATVDYKIAKAPIASVKIGNVTEPAPEAAPQETVEVEIDGVKSTVDIDWYPTDKPFKYDTEYTATIELTAGSNYEFTNQTSVSGQKDGWWKPSIDGNTLTLTHTNKTGEQQAPAPIPTIEAASPTNVTVYVGEKVTFKVKAENADLKWFKWSENDTPIETGKTGDTFEIDSVSLENDGDRYVCVAFGEEQAVQGPTFTLHVLNPGAPGAPAPTPAPQTGDASNIGLWLALSCISLAGMVAIVMQGKKKRI